jgi:hypothetical protein
MIIVYKNKTIIKKDGKFEHGNGKNVTNHYISFPIINYMC